MLSTQLWRSQGMKVGWAVGTEEDGGRKSPSGVQGGIWRAEARYTTAGDKHIDQAV